MAQSGAHWCFSSANSNGSSRMGAPRMNGSRLSQRHVKSSARTTESRSSCARLGATVLTPDCVSLNGSRPRVRPAAQRGLVSVGGGSGSGARREARAGLCSGRTACRRSVPPHWIPLLPVSVSAGAHAVRLQLREMLAPETGAPIPPQSVLLDTSGGPLELYEEEVPRVGARVRRVYRWTRWTDGSGHVWLARIKTAGRREGSSGLRFDTIDPVDSP